MAISRRAVGLGLLTISAAATGGYLWLRDNPHIARYFGETHTYRGFIGGEKSAFVENPRVVGVLARHSGIVLDARRAGSVEMIREKALLDQKPQFLWPSSSVLVDIAKLSGLKISKEKTIFNSPIVIYSWNTIADELVASGLGQSTGSASYTINLSQLLIAIVKGQKWADIGVDIKYGHVRIISTDPNRSNSGFMFAGLIANLLGGDIVTLEMLDTVSDKVLTVFKRMGYKPSSSGKLFDDYISGGPTVFPLIVGYENQLIEWALADAERWQRIEENALSKPVLLYPQPTVYSAHPLIVLDQKADALIDALISPEVQDIAWEHHGFRGPLGAMGKTRNPLLEKRLQSQLDAILPMPEARAMIALLERITTV